MKIDNFKISWVEAAQLDPYPRNARVHSKKQVRQIANSIKRFGFTNPVLVDDKDMILAGHGRLAAAKVLGMKEIPTIRLSHLNVEERRAYVLADNKLAQNADWDTELLALELGELAELSFDLELTGFSNCEIDIILDDAAQATPETSIDDADKVPEPSDLIVSKPGDLWRLGRHRLLCGDALQSDSFERVMEGRQANIIFTDPPYNVPIDGHVCGLGKVRHREFAMASGEMSRDQFTAFLASALTHASDHARDGAIAYVCMDWRHIGEVLEAGAAAFDELKNLCVWNKSNGGMGAFYRSKHELVFVFKKGSAPHVNNFGLGEGGRYRTNVWDYPGISSIGATRSQDLAMHPTVKPVALIADALKDCSRRGDTLLDPFGGSGSTLIAAQTTGRVARLIEIDPAYCDTIIRRFTSLTGKQAIHDQSDATFEAIEQNLGVEGAE
jgi:DNA modification methylase